MKIWNIINEYVEANKVINGVEFSKKWKLLKTYIGEPVRFFFSRINALCAEKLTKCEKEVPEGDIFALVLSSYRKIYLT